MCLWRTKSFYNKLLSRFILTVMGEVINKDLRQFERELT